MKTIPIGAKSVTILPQYGLLYGVTMGIKIVRKRRELFKRSKLFNVDSKLSLLIGKRSNMRIIHKFKSCTIPGRANVVADRMSQMRNRVLHNYRSCSDQM